MAVAQNTQAIRHFLKFLKIFVKVLIEMGQTFSTYLAWENSLTHPYMADKNNKSFK